VDSPHQNVSPTKHFVSKLMSGFEWMPFNKKPHPDHHVGSHLHLSANPLLGWQQRCSQWQGLQDSNMHCNSIGSMALACSKHAFFTTSCCQANAFAFTSDVNIQFLPIAFL
jgi:hypothetical protein